MDKETQELFGMIDSNQEKFIKQEIKEQEKFTIDRTNSLKKKKAKELDNLKKIRNITILALAIGTVAIVGSRIIKVDEPTITTEIINETPTQENVIDDPQAAKINRVINIENDNKRKILAEEPEEKIEKEAPSEEQEEETFIKGPAFEEDEEYSRYYEEFKKSNSNKYLKKYCKIYGVDYNLMVALFMQESKLGHDLSNSYAWGIGQIEDTNRDGADIVHNYETGEDEKIDYGYLSVEEHNIQVACQMMQYGANYAGANVCAMLTNYNQGITSTRKIACEVKRQKGQSTEGFRNDSKIEDWSGYIRVCTDQGDPNYISKVLSWLGNDTISYYSDGEKYEVNLETGTYTIVDENIKTK